MGPIVSGEYFGQAVMLPETSIEYHGFLSFTGHAFLHGVFSPVYLAFAGILVAWLLYIKFPDIPGKLAEYFNIVYRVLVNKYGFDDFNQFVFAGGARLVGRYLWQLGDVKIIDGMLVDGSALTVRWFSGIIRHIQTGYLYHYAFTMIIGLLLLLGLFVHHVI